MGLLHKVSLARLCSSSYNSLFRPTLRGRSHLTKPQSHTCSSVPLSCYCPQGISNSIQENKRYQPTITSSAIHTSSKLLSAFEDRETKSLVVWNNLKEVRKSPIPALTLGLSGLIPFIAAPLYLVTCGVYLPNIATAQVAYGATILSFLGGVRWGFTIPDENPIQPNWVNLGYSVTPSLIAWTGLLMPSPLSLFTVMGGLVFAGYMDLAMFGYPPWFKGLRFTLTFVALLSLWTTFMCSMLLSKEQSVKMCDDDKQSGSDNQLD